MDFKLAVANNVENRSISKMYGTLVEEKWRKPYFLGLPLIFMQLSTLK